MSHFTVGIILPNSIDGAKIEAQIDALLAPYSEHLEVEPYPHKCSCVGRHAESVGREEADRLVGTWDAQRDAFHETPEYLTRKAEPDFSAWNDEKANALWQAYTKDFSLAHRKQELATAQAQPDYQKPDPECDECHGTGSYQSTYNPKSKWD